MLHLLNCISLVLLFDREISYAYVYRDLVVPCIYLMFIHVLRSLINDVFFLLYLISLVNSLSEQLFVHC